MKIIVRYKNTSIAVQQYNNYYCTRDKFLKKLFKYIYIAIYIVLLLQKNDKFD